MISNVKCAQCAGGVAKWSTTQHVCNVRDFVQNALQNCECEECEKEKRSMILQVWISHGEVHYYKLKVKHSAV